MSRLRPLPLDVVSVQSQVVYGTVGNNVAVPALQALGLHVAAVPTVLLSNTPHYATLHGGAVPLAWFTGYLDGLLERDALADVRTLLVGYLGNPEQADALADWIVKIGPERPALRVQLDPVIGDHDHGTYVDPGLVDVYRSRLLPLAHGLTPNGYELEQLCGRRLPTLDATVIAARELLSGTTEWVAVTSAAPNGSAADELNVAIVTRDAAEIVSHARVASSAKGTGDLFAAVLAGQRLRGVPLASAVRAACDAVVTVLQRTCDAGCAELLI